MRFDRACYMTSATLGALWALARGQDADFDIKNYHWHNAWSALRGRWAVDLAPAQMQGFNNPLIDIPPYLLAQVHPALAGAALGAVHGLLGGAAAVLARRLLTAAGAPHPAALGAACGAVGYAGAISLALHGGWFGDPVVALLVLLSLLVAGPLRAGLLVGAAVGLKPTAAPWGLALLAALSWERGPWRRWLVGAAAGFLLTAGPWMAVMTWRTGSPLFPQANTLFRSDWAPLTSYAERRFHPDGVLGHLLWPLRTLRGGEEVGWEYDWRDPRLLLALASTTALPFLRRAEDALLRRVLMAVLLGWGAWQAAFLVVRYQVLTQVLGPALAATVAARFLRRPYGALLVGAALCATSKPADLPRTPWAPTAFSVDVPAVPKGALVLLVGDQATAYLLPSFPPGTRFARLGGNLAWWDEDTAMNAAIAAAIRDAPSLWLLDGPEPADPAALDVHGLERVGQCAPVRSAVDAPLALCPLRRVRETPWPPPEPVEPDGGP